MAYLGIFVIWPLSKEWNRFHSAGVWRHRCQAHLRENEMRGYFKISSSLDYRQKWDYPKKSCWSKLVLTWNVTAPRSEPLTTPARAFVSNLSLEILKVVPSIRNSQNDSFILHHTKRSLYTPLKVVPFWLPRSSLSNTDDRKNGEFSHSLNDQTFKNSF